jgi:hypothetical protein
MRLEDLKLCESTTLLKHIGIVNDYETTSFYLQQHGMWKIQVYKIFFFYRFFLVEILELYL